MLTYTSNMVRYRCHPFPILPHKLTRCVVVKNPLSPIEHPGGVGVNNELFEESLEQFVVGFCSLELQRQCRGPKI